jgi:hypothetical protein
MAFEEHTELVQPGVGDDVDDNAATGEVDTNREPLWEYRVMRASPSPTVT